MPKNKKRNQVKTANYHLLAPTNSLWSNKKTKQNKNRRKRKEKRMKTPSNPRPLKKQKKKNIIQGFLQHPFNSY
jgi:hypothetical protein